MLITGGDSGIGRAVALAFARDFTGGLAQLLADKGIQVNAVAPGPVWTPLIPSTMRAEHVGRSINSCRSSSAADTMTVAAAIFSVVGVTFAVLLAFVAMLAWDGFNKAKAAGYAEAAAVLDVHNVAVGLAGPEARDARRHRRLPHRLALARAAGRPFDRIVLSEMRHMLCRHDGHYYSYR